jgi:hypothetical protein
MVAISEAELEVKATMQRAQGNDLIVEPVSSAGREGRHIGALSTFRVRYVAGAEAAAAALGGRPIKTAKAVIDEIRARRDVAALDKILAGLKIEAARRQPIAGS